jgi:two-component system, cell cycle sensor histidine kinase and response regulator CckA
MIAGTKILIVEDDGIIAEDISENLTRLGYEQMAIAHDGRSAVDMALEMRPDIVLMDIKLRGDLDGIQTAEQIRRRVRAPIVYLTANAEPDALQRAKMTEPFGYLLKPYKAQELRSTIEMALFKSQMEERLRESERRFASTLRDLGDAVITADACGAVTFMNPAAEKLTQWSAGEARGRSVEEVFQIVCPGDLATAVSPAAVSLAAVSPARDALEKGRPVDLPGEVLLKTRGGGLIAAIGSATPVHGETGGVAGVAIVFRDMTGRKQMEEKLRHSQKMEALGRLASAVAHDFSNLLNVIRGHTTRILEETGDKHLLHRASQIRKATERAISLTHQLLMVSRKPAYEHKIFDLRDAVGDLNELLRSMISARIDLKLSVPDEPALIRADPGQIEHVLMNLALNARDSMAHGGTLTVEVRHRLLRDPLISRSTTVLPGDYVLLAVSDTGSGMDPATIERIFEPFFTTKEKGKGTGLGLTAVYTIVNECDAGVMVESEPGAGSRFTIYFPRQTGQECAAAAQA